MDEINWFGILQQTLLITSFVIMMMLLIEFINVYTKGKFVNKLKNKPISQIFIGVALGLLPGCMGAFTVVSLYTHRVLSFGALVAAMIATSGDEAFFMFIMIPDKVLIIFAVMTVAAIITGFATDKLFKKFSLVEGKNFKFEVHENQCLRQDTKLLALKNFNFSISRTLIVIALILTMVGASAGWIMHTHGHNILFSLPENIETEFKAIESEHSCGHSHHDHSCSHETDSDASTHSATDHDHGIDWIAVSIVFVALISLILILFASEHFVKIHIWKHLFFKHLPKIFLWTLGIMILINVVLTQTEFGDWIYENMLIVLLIAIIIGIIPESGPHLLFLVLFAYGQIPLSVLIASSIVQDGHGSLPLLAESKSSFFAMKLINMIVAFIIGYSGLLIGY